MPVILIYLLISIILVTVILPVWAIRGLEKKWESLSQNMALFPKSVTPESTCDSVAEVLYGFA